MPQTKTTYQAEGYPAEKWCQRTSTHPYTHAAILEFKDKTYPSKIIACSTSEADATKLGKRYLKGYYPQSSARGLVTFKVVALKPIKGGHKK